jgi:hypothetical protein
MAWEPNVRAWLAANLALAQPPTSHVAPILIASTSPPAPPSPPTPHHDHSRSSDLSSISGAAPGSRSQGWGRGERKPPHFHVPFRAYPGLLGEPRGRDVGLDRFYNIDSTGATPIALNGTLEVNMRRHPRHYAATFKSKQPARPIRDLDAGAGFLGPGSYPTPKGCIQLKEPSRPSSAFIPFSGGMYAGVGGSYADYLNAKPNIREFDYGQPRGS